MKLNSEDEKTLCLFEAVLNEMEKGTIDCEDVIVDSYYEKVTGYDAIESAHIHLRQVDSTIPYKDMNTPEGMLTEVVKAIKSGKFTNEMEVLNVYDNNISLYEAGESLHDVLIYGFEPHVYSF